MGAGASAREVQKTLQSASADELNAAASDLPPDVKERVRAAFAEKAPTAAVEKAPEAEKAPTADVEKAPEAEKSPEDESAAAAEVQLETKTSISAKPASAKFVAANPGVLHKIYQLERLLGEGGYANVKKAKNKESGDMVAVKTIAKPRMKNTEALKLEVELQSSMDHPNICKLWETFEDHRNLYLVMELMTGGELFERLIDAGHFSEKQASVLAKQAFQALSYMNDQGVCHRDLKPENFLFLNDEPISRNTMKLVDFGLACKCEKDQVLKTKAGTAFYVAPQVLAGKYDIACDVWSLGVILYILICGYPPFAGETDGAILRKVRLGKYKFDEDDWGDVSEACKNLITMCLKLDPRERFTPDQVLKHSWFSEMESAEPVAADTKFLDRFRQFCSATKFQKVARQFIAMRAKEGDITKLKKAFLAVDVDGNGTLTFDELKQAIEKAGLEDIPSDFMDLMNTIGSQGSSRLNYTDFLAATIDQKVYTSEDQLWSAFRMFDKDGDGGIDVEELKKMLTDGVEELSTEARAASEQLITEADKNGDSKIDFNEFAEMMKASAAV